MTRTSETHPLIIGTLTIPRIPGRLGLTFCPGKHQRDAHTGAWARDLDTDLAVIQDWGADALVSLIEAHEFEALRVPHLGRRAEELGLEWHHLPIPDLGIPSAAWEDKWALTGRRIRRLLTVGTRVVLHCKGGLGRTGTVAARLLVEFGVEPDEAIRRVRASRPNAIDVGLQEDYVRRCEPLSGRAAMAHPKFQSGA